MFIDSDGRTFLVYAYAREKGLAIGEVKWQGDPDGSYGNASTVYASCQDMTVSLDAGGNAFITPGDVDDGSSGCGITLSIDRSTFICADVGANVVTLTAMDSDGNTSTCVAVVTITGGVDTDADSDGVVDCQDNCPLVANPDQQDVEVAGAVSVWRFDEATGTTAFDSFGSNDGTIFGAGYGSGQVNTALDFDGVNDYVAHGLSIGTQGTLVHWLRPAQIRAMVAYYESNGTGSSYNGFANATDIREIHSSVSGSQYHFLYQDGTTPVAVAGGTPVAGVWMHVAVTWDTAGDLILYVNGTEVDRQALSTVTLAGHPATIRRFGRVGNGQTARHWHGLMDEVAVFSRALTAGEINGIYTLGLSDGVGDACDICPGHNDDGPDADSDGVSDACDICPGFNDSADVDNDGVADGCDNCPTISNPDQANADAEGILAAWRFDEGNGITAFDSVGSTDGTLSGATFVSDSLGSVLDFDGDNDWVDFGDIDVLDTPGAFSIALRFLRRSEIDNPTNVHSVRNVLVAQSSGPTNDNLEMGSSGGSMVVYLHTANFDGTASIPLDSPIQDNIWYHLVLTYDMNELPNELKLYIDGVLGAERADWGGPLTTSSTSPLTIGVARPGDADPAGDFDGQVDDVVLFNRALTLTEVQMLFAGGINTVSDAFGDACDICLSGDDTADANADSIPDACDACAGGVASGDTDANGSVDLNDHADLEACLAGPGGGLGTGCECFDFDGDNDNDLGDFAVFQISFGN